MPSACRLSQTLGHAKDLFMRAQLSFVSPHALSHGIQVAAGASPPKRSAKVAWFRRHCRPTVRFAESAQWRRLEGKQGRHAPWQRSRLGAKPKIQVGLAQPRPSSSNPTHSLSPKLQGHFTLHPCGSPCQPLVCFAIQMQTRIQGKAVAHRAWPNPSFKRTRLRRSA